MPNTGAVAVELAELDVVVGDCLYTSRAGLGDGRRKSGKQSVGLIGQAKPVDAFSQHDLVIRDPQRSRVAEHCRPNRRDDVASDEQESDASWPA